MRNQNTALVSYFSAFIFDFNYFITGSSDCNSQQNVGAYTVFYYLTQIVGNGVFDNLKILGVGGVVPNKNTIFNGTYPFTAEVYMIIRSDLDRSSMAYKVYEFIQTKVGQQIVAKADMCRLAIKLNLKINARIG